MNDPLYNLIYHFYIFRSVVAPSMVTSAVSPMMAFSSISAMVPSPVVPFFPIMATPVMASKNEIFYQMMSETYPWWTGSWWIGSWWRGS